MMNSTKPLCKVDIMKLGRYLHTKKLPVRNENISYSHHTILKPVPRMLALCLLFLDPVQKLLSWLWGCRGHEILPKVTSGISCKVKLSRVRVQVHGGGPAKKPMRSKFVSALQYVDSLNKEHVWGPSNTSQISVVDHQLCYAWYYSLALHLDKVQTACNVLATCVTSITVSVLAEWYSLCRSWISQSWWF